MINLTNNFNLGYFNYNNEIFINAHEVYEKILLLKDPDPKITLYFHDDVYSNIDWSIEPEFTFEDLYLQRAKQLREQYDYLVLMFSGGADSSQILSTFLNNNIFIDEVRSVYPLKLSERIDEIKNPNSPYGILYEYKGAAVPQLKVLSEKSPKTKIRIVDFSDNFLNPSNDEHFYIWRDSYVYSHDWFNLSRGISQTVSLINDMQNIQGKVGVIYGVDKPKLKIVNNKLIFNFTAVGRSTPTIVNVKKPYTDELFFWSPTNPLIPIKQSHIILKLLNIAPKLKKIIRNNTLLSKLIYPNFLPNLYQNDKLVLHSPQARLNFPMQRIFESLENKTLNKVYERFQFQKNQYRSEVNIDITKKISLTQSKDYIIGNINT